LTTLTISVPSTEVLESALLTLDQISTRLTVLALNASRNPEQSGRVRALLSDILAGVQDLKVILDSVLDWYEVTQKTHE
jgi:hypothetical protein